LGQFFVFLSIFLMFSQNQNVWNLTIL
jgi:hypothetical protein